MSVHVLLNLSNMGNEIKCEAYQVYHIITTCSINSIILEHESSYATESTLKLHSSRFCHM